MSPISRRKLIYTVAAVLSAAGCSSTGSSPGSSTNEILPQTSSRVVRSQRRAGPVFTALQERVLDGDLEALVLENNLERPGSVPKGVSLYKVPVPCMDSLKGRCFFTSVLPSSDAPPAGYIEKYEVK